MITPVQYSQPSEAITTQQPGATIDHNSILDDKFFTVGLFEIGDCNSCAYSWLCYWCAKAEARTYLDGSGCLFNLFCMHLAPLRWLVRSAYGIGDVSDPCGWEDCICACFCPCCTVNQLYQTTVAKGNPTTDGGAAFNVNNFSPNSSACDCCMCCYAFFCLPCSVGTIVNDSVGMPWFIGCCCMNIFSARNVLRYQYRIRRLTGDSDCLEECFWPCLTYVAAWAIAWIVPCIGCAICAGLTAISTGLQEEAKAKGSGSNKKYLKGYTVPQKTVSQVPQVVYVVQPTETVTEVYVGTSTAPPAQV